MWKFTNKIPVLRKADPKKKEGLGIIFVAEFSNGEAIEHVGTTVDDLEQMNTTIRTIEARLNKRDAEMAAIDQSNYVLPEIVEPEVKEPTVEEIKSQELAQAEQELNEAFEKAKRDKEIAELASVNEKFKAKVLAVEAKKR